MTTPLFRIGDLVTVDDRDTAYILCVSINNDTILYKVKYSVGNQTENDVEQTRCKSTTIFGGTSNRSGVNRHFPASSAIQRQRNAPSNNTNRNSTPSPPSSPY